MLRAGWQCAVVMVLGATAAAERAAPQCAAAEAAFVKAPSSTDAMFEIAACNEAGGRLASAVQWYRRAQAAAAERGDVATEAWAKEHTLTIAGRVASIALEVTPGASVEIDGFLVRPSQYWLYELDAGDHELVGRAPGKRTVRMRIRAADGTRELVKVAVVEDLPIIDRGRARKRGALVLGGAGAAVFGASLAYGFYARARYNDANTSNEERDRIVTRMRYPVTATTLLGLAAVTAGVVMYLTAPGKERMPEGTAFAPLVGDGQLGLAAAGSF